MRLTSQALVHACPPHASTAYEYTYYGKAAGLDKVRVRYLDIGSDIFDEGSLAFSTDNGKSWGDSRPHVAGRKTAEGTVRRFDGIGFVDPVGGRLVNLYLEGLFRKDNSLEGMTQYALYYCTSADGGRSSLVDEQVIQAGKTGAFTAEHPIDGVWIGRNGITMPSTPPVVCTPDGRLVLAVMVSVLGPDGTYHNPGGGFTWLENRILIGRWRADWPGAIAWESGARLAIEPEKSTRGLDESTMVQMPDGRLLLVLRASNGGKNDPDCRIPGRKWFAVSRDGGLTWSTPEPWGYDDGSLFYSPASMSQLLRHSSGRCFWLGNICPANPRGNRPRFPLVIAEVAPSSLRLVRESVFAVDTQRTGEPETQLSNFYAHEDRADNTLILDMPRLMRVGDRWKADTYRYRLEV